MSRENTMYGRRKLDEKAYTAQQQKKAVTIGRTVYGKRKGGPTVEEPQEQEPSRFEGLNLKELEDLLGEKPELLDEAIAFEFADGDPRKGAVELFLKIEEAQADPREKVVNLLKGVEVEGATE